MTAANQQIITAFEDLQLTPEEIAREQELEITAVKAVLMQFSSVYRKMCKVESDSEAEFNFKDHELAVANQSIAELAAYAENEAVRLKAAIYLRDDRKGRLDAVKTLSGLNINVLTINEQMKKAMAAIQRSKGVVIDAEEVKELPINQST